MQSTHIMRVTTKTYVFSRICGRMPFKGIQMPSILSSSFSCCCFFLHEESVGVSSQFFFLLLLLLLVYPPFFKLSSCLLCLSLQTILNTMHITWNMNVYNAMYRSIPTIRSEVCKLSGTLTTIRYYYFSLCIMILRLNHCKSKSLKMNQMEL